MKRVVVGSVEEFARASPHRNEIDGNDHRPFETLRLVDRDDVDAVSGMIGRSLVESDALVPFARQVDRQLLQPSDVIAPRPFEQACHVRESATAFVRTARGHYWQCPETIQCFGKKGVRSRPAAPPPKIGEQFHHVAQAFIRDRQGILSQAQHGARFVRAQCLRRIEQLMLGEAHQRAAQHRSQGERVPVVG